MLRSSCFFISLFLAALLPSSTLGQITFERTYGGAQNDLGFAVSQTLDAGYIVVGGTNSFGAGQRDIYLLKTDSSGNALWTRTFGGNRWEDGYSVQQTLDGGYILVGYTLSFGAGGEDVLLIRTDPLGDSLWIRTFGGIGHEQGWSAQQTQDGGFVVVGYTESFGAGGRDVYIVRTDSSGDTTWTRTYGGSLDDEGYSLEQTPDGGYIIAGQTDSYGAGQHDFYLIKTDSVGDTIWTRTYGDSLDDYGSCVQLTGDGGYVIAGDTYSFGAVGTDAYLVKTDSAGDSVWTRTYGGDGDDRAHSVQQTDDGGFAIGGETSSYGGGDENVYFVKTDPWGDSLWVRAYGGSSNDMGWSIRQTEDKGYIISGTTNSYGAGNYDFYLVKTSPTGWLQWNDVGLLDISAPPDTVIAESTEAVLANVCNLGNATVNFIVVATIDGYIDTSRVQNLAPDSSTQVIFTDWQVPAADSTAYNMTVCTHLLGDVDPSTDCAQKSIFAYAIVHDAEVLGIGAPPDTVLPNSSQVVVAAVRNSGNTHLSFDVVAAIDGYADTVQVTNLGPGMITQRTFSEWQVPSADSATYIITVCTHLVGDVDTTNDCFHKEIFSYDPTGIQERRSSLYCQGLTTELVQNIPNPFRGSTVISYALAQTYHTRLEILDVTGRVIETLLDTEQNAGVHGIEWLPGDRPSGTYFSRLRAGDLTFTGKILFVD